MTTTETTIPTAVPPRATAPEKTCAERIADLIAESLTGLHRINNAFVRTEATVGTDGYITLLLTDYGQSFSVPDRVMRVLLHPTAPVDVTPAPEPGPEAA